ncbi:capsule assembly Wzi family protein [Flavobacteriales bacterium]|nr:capsule assembly Wzi family protein [Flavobacteriales bacterium]
MIFRRYLCISSLVLIGFTESSAQRLITEHSAILETFLQAEPMRSGAYNGHYNIRPVLLSQKFMDARNSALESFVFANSSSLRRFSDGHFVDYKKKWFGLEIDPIYHNIARYGTESGFTTELIGGLRGNVLVGKNFLGHFSVRGGAFKPVEHVRQFMDANNVNPGQGDFNQHSYFRSFFDPSGSLSYSPSKHFNVQVGHDKLFLGNGYRTLFLSDNAEQYSFLKLDTRVWRLRYVNIWANFKDVRPGAIRNKLGTFHYLSLNIAKRFNIGLFESIIWQGADSTGARGFELNYINPIIFYRPVEFSLNSADNVVLGFDFRYRIGKNNHLYGQLVLDEFLLGEVFKNITARNDSTVQKGFWGNKQGFQVGIKGWNLLWIKDLYYQFEFNWVRPFTYTHVTIEQNYGHYNQSLAHPMGANFMESVNVLRYRKNNWLIEGKFIWANYGLDTNNVSYGSNIFKSYLLRDGEYNHKMIQGLDTKLYLWQFKAEYVLNGDWDMRLMVGFSTRVEESAIHRKEELYFFFGISSDITRPFDGF